MGFNLNFILIVISHVTKEDSPTESKQVIYHKSKPY
jgi:hypothetical protein